MLIYIDMDDVLCDFSAAHSTALKKNPGIKYPQSQYGFFTNLSAISGGVEAVKAMIAADGFEPYILTAPSTRNPLCYTEKRLWIEAYFDLAFLDRLIISPNKGLLKGDVLIDDRIHGNGQENFEGRVLQFGGEVFPDWSAVRAELGI